MPPKSNDMISKRSLLRLLPTLYLLPMVKWGGTHDFFLSLR